MALGVQVWTVQESSENKSKQDARKQWFYLNKTTKEKTCVSLQSRFTLEGLCSRPWGVEFRVEGRFMVLCMGSGLMFCVARTHPPFPFPRQTLLEKFRDGKS